MLPPVTDVLTLLDHSLVTNDWQANPSTLRRVIQMLVDHISVQGAQLSRVEDIMASFGSQSSQGGTIWSKLSAKADLARLEKLECLVDDTREQMSRAATKQADVLVRLDEVSARMALLRDQASAMDARVGGVGGLHGSALAALGLAPSHAGDSNGALSGMPMALALLGGGGSVMERIGKLEKRVDNTQDAVAGAKREVCGLATRTSEAEARAELTLNGLRGEIKQALAAAAASTKAEAESASSGRVKEMERRLTARIHSVEETLEGKVSSLSTQMGSVMAGELDKRLSGVYDQLDMQAHGLRVELERLSRDKVDMSTLELYTQRITELFEQVAGGVSEETRSIGQRLNTDVSAMQRDVDAQRMEGKALQEKVQSEMEAMRTMGQQVREVLAGMSEAVAAAPVAVKELRAELQHVAELATSTQRTAAGMASAVGATGDALEVQVQRTAALAQRVASTSTDLACLKDTVYGPGSAAGPGPVLQRHASSSGAGGGGEEGARPTTADQGAPGSLVLRLAELERGIVNVVTAISAKADDGAMRELERKLASASRQVDASAEGLRTLTGGAFKRLDEHASAIQKLSMAITSHLDERPTSSAMRSLVEGSMLEVRERCEAALSPLWDAVKLLQAGVRDGAGALAGVQQDLGVLQQAQAETRGRLSADKSSLLTALRGALDEELLAQRAALEARVGGMEDTLRRAAQQMEVQAQLQDRHGTLVAAVEDQMTAQAESLRTSSAALRADYMSKVEALLGRLESVQGGHIQTAADVQALRDANGLYLNEAAGRVVADAVSRGVVRGELAKHAEREELKWQVFLDKYASFQERVVGRDELTAALGRAAGEAARELAQATGAQLEELRRSLAAARADLEGRVSFAGGRLGVMDERLVELERIAAGHAQDLADMSQLLATKADAAAADQRLRALQGALAAVEARVGDLHDACSHMREDIMEGLAAKVDVATYLANTKANAAAAVAGAFVRSGGAAEVHQVGTAAGRAGRAAGASAGPASGQGLSAAAAVARAAERLRGRSAAAAHESME